MPKIDLFKMELGDLKELQRDVAKAIASFDERRRKEALAALEARAREFGFSVGELTGGKVRRTKTVGAARFANPQNASETWSGKGRKPRWYIAAIDAGQVPDDLLIK